jgi:hypothetical protein
VARRRSRGAPPCWLRSIASWRFKDDRPAQPVDRGRRSARAVFLEPRGMPAGIRSSIRAPAPVAWTSRLRKRSSWPINQHGEMGTSHRDA